MTLYSLVIPVYKNADSLAELIVILNRINADLDSQLEVVFVVDGSPDSSFSDLKLMLSEAKFQSKLCLHSRNFGRFEAIRTGLEEGSGEYFATISADLQEPAELVINFFKALQFENADVAIASRLERDDPWQSRIFSFLFWSFYRRFIFPEVPPGGMDVFACTRQVRDELLKLRELHSSLITLLLWVGFKRVFVPYQRVKRPYGQSTWTFLRKLDLMFDFVYSFTNLPIRFLKFCGGLAFTGSLILGLVIFLNRLGGYVEVPGYASTVLFVMFFGGLNSLGLGIVGEYAWRTFENTKQRPSAILKSVLSYEPKR